MKTPTPLNFTAQYEQHQDTLDGLMSTLGGLCTDHRKLALVDLNGLGETNYRNVSEISEVIDRLRAAVWAAQEAVSRQELG